MIERVSSASFIGREAELAQLEAALADAGEGRPSLVFVAGESGVGKSRLLREFGDRARAAGAQVLGGDSVELGGDELPYAPLVGALRPLARAGDPVFEQIPATARAELARLLPELGPAPERSGEIDGDVQRRLFEALLTVLEALGREAPVVLWLEDIHWADRSTRSFCVFLARSLRDERVVALLTYRPDELHRRHPLRPLLAELERGTSSTRIELTPFDRSEIAAQLADILGAEASGDVVERLFSRSGGNPLFTEELVAGGLDGRGPLPPTLREALLLRLERLEPTAQHAMRALAVAGSADDATLARATEAEVAEIREALRDGVAAKILEASDDGAFSFRHALLREVVYDDLLPGERAECHLDFARALEQADGGQGAWRLAEIAHHYHSGGDQAQALRAAIEAATQLDTVRAHGEAAALLERALGLWQRVESPEGLAGQDRAGLLFTAARQRYLAGEDDRTITLLESARAELDPAREPLRLATVLGMLASRQWSQGKADRARETLAEALALLPEEPAPVAVELLAHQARFDMLRGRFADAERTAARALEAAGALGLAAARPGILNRLGSALFGRGEHERGEETFRQAIEEARRSSEAGELAVSYANYADALLVAGRDDEADALLAREFEGVGHNTRVMSWVVLGRAEIAFARGDWGRARRELPELDRLEPGITRAHALIRTAEQALGRGEHRAARAALTETDELIADAVEPQFIAAAAALRAELESREGNFAEARAAIDRALDRVEFCTEDLTRLGQIAAAGIAVEASRAQSARDLGDGEEVRHAIECLRGLTLRVEAAAEEISSPVEAARMATARADLARAVEAADQAALWSEAAGRWRELGRPYPEAQACWRQSEAHLAAGEREQAAAAAATALASARDLGAQWLIDELESLVARGRLELGGDAPAPQPEAPAENPFDLTERERQVLELVVTGATNREIGARLFMAEKTASVHVSRILGKLDVRSRTEAATVAHRQGLVGAPPAEG